MCDRCELEMALYGEKTQGFSCSDVTSKLLAEEANGIARFPGRGKPKPGMAGETSNLTDLEAGEGRKD